MLASDETALRGYCARILGWSDERAVDVENALLSIHLSATHRAALVLLGDFDLVPIAHALHRRTVGAERPFVVCDPRRQDVHASVRLPPSQPSGVAAFEAARGGSLCVRVARRPHDFSSAVAMARAPTASVQLIVCAEARYDRHPFLTLPAPIRVPSLEGRAGEVPRIVDEYALEAIESLSAAATGFTRTDRDWVIAHSASSLPEIEKGTRRLVAIRQAGSIARAAEQLGMSHVALRHWLCRRSRRRIREAPER